MWSLDHAAAHQLPESDFIFILIISLSTFQYLTQLFLYLLFKFLHFYFILVESKVTAANVTDAEVISIIQKY